MVRDFEPVGLRDDRFYFQPYVTDRLQGSAAVVHGVVPIAVQNTNARKVFFVVQGPAALPLAAAPP